MKNSRIWLPLVFVALSLALILPAAAQETLPAPERVTITGADGRALVGSYYPPAAGETDAAPAILLMHQMNANRDSWSALVPALHEAGYAVLSVDLCGHGETGGTRDWVLGEEDVQLWLDWLREQEGLDPARLNLAGASIGSNLALRGMANDPAVVTAVALSPGLNYSGVSTDDAITTIGQRPVFLLAAQQDTYSADSVRELALLAQGDLQLRIINARTHGTSMLESAPDLPAAIVGWLNAQNS